MNTWMQTLPLPRFFLLYATTLYAGFVGFGTTGSELLFNEPWQRSSLAGAAFVAVSGAIGSTARERARRRHMTTDRA